MEAKVHLHQIKVQIVEINFCLHFEIRSGDKGRYQYLLLPDISSEVNDSEAIPRISTFKVSSETNEIISLNLESLVVDETSDRRR